MSTGFKRGNPGCGCDCGESCDSAAWPATLYFTIKGGTWPLAQDATTGGWSGDVTVDAPGVTAFADCTPVTSLVVQVTLLCNSSAPLINYVWGVTDRANCSGETGCVWMQTSAGSGEETVGTFSSFQNSPVLATGRFGTTTSDCGYSAPAPFAGPLDGEPWSLSA